VRCEEHGEAAVTTDPFHHEAVLYASDDQYLRGVVPFVREGVDAGEPVLVAVPRARLELLRTQLGRDAAAVRFEAMEELGRNPAWIIPAWTDFVEEHGGAPVRGVGEPITLHRDPAALTECQRHETLLNLAFAGRQGFRLLCPYDEVNLPEAVLSEARRSHPWLSHETQRCRSEAYAGTDHGRHDVELGEPPPWSSSMAVSDASLRQARALVRQAAQDGGLGGRTGDLVLAVEEALTNSILHGGGSARLALWSLDGTVYADVRDGGRLTDPLAGRVRPPATTIGGRGLWLMHRVCDLVQISPLAAGGQAIRLQVTAEPLSSSEPGGESLATSA
jgi:anti-sigma regulatory factor (Ser/Thr protein kinase)